MILAAPAGAAGWGEVRFWAGGLYQHVLAGLGFAPSWAPNQGIECDHGSQIDPNGCPKAGASIDPNGARTASATSGETTDHGLSIDPNG